MAHSLVTASAERQSGLHQTVLAVPVQKSEVTPPYIHPTSGTSVHVATTRSDKQWVEKPG